MSNVNDVIELLRKAQELFDAHGYYEGTHTDHAEQCSEAIALLEGMGEVVITTNPQTGQCVAVTRQDDEGQVLSVVWEAGHPPTQTAAVLYGFMKKMDQHALTASECPPGSRVVLLSSIKRLAAPNPTSDGFDRDAPCPICNGVEGCSHTVSERRRAWSAPAPVEKAPLTYGEQKVIDFLQDGINEAVQCEVDDQDEEFALAAEAAILLLESRGTAAPGEGEDECCCGEAEQSWRLCPLHYLEGKDNG